MELPPYDWVVLHPLPTLAPRKRLHTLTGSPYDEALRDIHDANGGKAKVWKAQQPMKASDLLVTSVATVPRMYICVEALRSDFDPLTSSKIDIDPNNWVNFDNGILAPAIDKALGWKVEASATYRGGDARAILAALDAEYQLNIPWFTPLRWRDV
ncbi:hypothetical protein ACIGKQ_17775 [Gordonia sp. NPDC062954]|uniref:hypothetical protein n=1 Tax=Gordonia sp. NPDC062954 TaxID=3364003 RepID=UPI0037C94C1A